MRIGSFFVILLLALVALGYFFSDSLHLREDISGLQKENQRLSASLQKAEQDKQNALMTLQSVEQEKASALVSLQNTTQELQSCRQQVEQVNQTLRQTAAENALIKDQNRLLISAVQNSGETYGFSYLQTPLVKSSAISLVAFFVVALGSVIMMTLKKNRNHFTTHGHSAKSGAYIYLTDAEIRELIKRRRHDTDPLNSEPIE